MSNPAYEARVAELTRELASLPPRVMPGWLKDQIETASAEAVRGLVRIKDAIARGELDRFHPSDDEGWSQGSLEFKARLMLALSQCTPCGHLHNPRVFYVRLGLRRSDCTDCLNAELVEPEPPPEDADRCDWCGAKGVVIFTPHYIQQGPAIVLGNACDDCNKAIREA